LLPRLCTYERGVEDSNLKRVGSPECPPFCNEERDKRAVLF